MAIKSIDADDLKSKLDAKEQLILVDCREQGEWDEEHIEIAKHIPLGEFESRFAELNDKQGQIILQCRSGKRSMRAAEFLAEKGYTDLTNLEGGIISWTDHGFDTIKG